MVKIGLILGIQTMMYVPMKAHEGLCKANRANNGKQTKEGHMSGARHSHALALATMIKNRILKG